MMIANKSQKETTNKRVFKYTKSLDIESSTLIDSQSNEHSHADTYSPMEKSALKVKRDSKSNHKR